jgi:hypothetical protein
MSPRSIEALAFSVILSWLVDANVLQPVSGMFRDRVKLSSGHMIGSMSRASVRVALTCIILAPMPGSWLIS